MAFPDDLFGPPGGVPPEDEAPDILSPVPATPGTPDDGDIWHGLLGAPVGEEPQPDIVTEPAPTPEPEPMDFGAILAEPPLQTPEGPGVHPDRGLVARQGEEQARRLDEVAPGFEVDRPPGAEPPPAPQEEFAQIMAGKQAPDAITGGEVPEQDVTVTEEATPAEQPEARQFGTQYSDLGAEEFAAEQARRKRAQETAQNELLAKSLREDRQAQEANEEMLREAAQQAQARYAEIEQDAKELANRRIDPDRWWSSRSTGQKISSYVSAIVSGFLSAGRGPNEGLGLIQQAIDRDLAAQRADLANQQQALDARRGIVGDLYGAHRDEYRAAEAARLAAWERIDAELAKAASEVDPEGTTAMRIEAARRNARANMEAARREAYQQALDNELAVRSQALEERKQRLAEVESLARRQDEARARAAAGRRKPEEVKPDPRKPVKIWDANAGGYIERPLSEDESELAVNAPGSGVTVLARTRDEAKDLRDSLKGIYAANRSINDINILRRKHGFEPGAFGIDTKAGQQLKALHNDLKLRMKEAYKLGVLSKDDLQLVESIVGKDPTTLLDQTTARLERLQGILEDGLHSGLRVHDQSLPRSAVQLDVYKDPEAASHEELSERLSSLQNVDGTAKTSDEMVADVTRDVTALRRNDADPEDISAAMRGHRDRINDELRRLQDELDILDRTPSPEMTPEKIERQKQLNAAIEAGHAALRELHTTAREWSATAKKSRERKEAGQKALNMGKGEKPQSRPPRLFVEGLEVD